VERVLPEALKIANCLLAGGAGDEVRELFGNEFVVAGVEAFANASEDKLEVRLDEVELVVEVLPHALNDLAGARGGPWLLEKELATGLGDEEKDEPFCIE